jgi:hypothetical protein
MLPWPQAVTVINLTAEGTIEHRMLGHWKQNGRGLAFSTELSI